MPNQIILSMQQNYPFGTEYIPEKENQQVLVRKLILSGKKKKNYFKAKHLKKLNAPHSIQIISIFQHTESIQIYYEYVPVKFQIWMKNMSDELSDNLLKQLYALTTFLAQNQVSTTFNPENLGLDRNYHIKYFIDLQNTFYDENENSSTLKQKYYSEISLLIDSLNSNSDKTLSSTLLSSMYEVKNQRFQPPHNSVRSIPRNLFKSSSTKTLYMRNRSQMIRSEIFENAPENWTQMKYSALGKKCYKINFNEKIKNIRQKIQNIKPKESKMNQSLHAAQNCNKNKDFRTATSQIMKQSAIQINQSREASFGTPVSQRQISFNLFRKQFQNISESKISHSQKNIHFIQKSKKNYSQKFKSPNNSQSPIQYLDIIKLPSFYIQDFLNVLEDSSESDNCLVEQKEVKKSTQYQEREEALLSTQQSQGENEKQDKKWKKRLHEVIQNSKNLIKRLQSPVRPSI